MSINWEIEHNNLIVFRVSGQLGKNEYDHILVETESIIKQKGEIKLLVFLKNFTGWESAEGWEDTTFASRNDQFIKKFAIVGDEKWRDLVTVFTLKGLRPIPIEYFLPDQENTAREWLSDNKED